MMSVTNKFDLTLVPIGLKIQSIIFILDTQCGGRVREHPLTWAHQNLMKQQFYVSFSTRFAV